MISRPAMKTLDVETYLVEVRAREPKSQQSIERSVEIWSMRSARKTDPGEIAPDGIPYSAGPKPRKTFSQPKAQGAQ